MGPAYLLDYILKLPPKLLLIGLVDCADLVIVAGAQDAANKHLIRADLAFGSLV